MIDSGISKKARRNKGLVDKISATIILQSYFVKTKIILILNIFLYDFLFLIKS